MASKTKKQQIQQNKAAVAVSKAANVNIDTSLTALSQASVKIQGDLSKIGEQLIQKHAELQVVDESIRLKKEEMAALFGTENALLTLDEAKALHTTFLDEAAKQRQQIEQEHMDLGAQRQQERDREEEEYNYKLQQTRKTDQDEWNEKIRVQQNNERDRKEAFEKDLATRTAALVAKETEYQAAIQKAATFEQEVDARVKREVAIVTNTLTKDFNHKQELAAINHTSQLNNQIHDNKRLTETLNNYEVTIKELQQQLKDAYSKNAELATKAVDGAANAKAQADAIATLSNLSSGNGTRART